MNDVTNRPRKPIGVPGAGEWTAHTHGEATLTLGGPAAPAGLDLETILQQVADRNGPGAVPGVEHELAKCTTDGGRELYLQRCDAIYNPESEYTVEHSLYEPNAEQCDKLAALGYTSVNEFSSGKRKNLQGIDSIIRGGIEPERLALLGKLLTHEYQWSGWEKEAYRTLPLEDLKQVVNDPRAAIVQYRDLMHRLDPAKGARADECFELGLRDRGLIEATQHAPEVYLDLRRALPDSKRGSWYVVSLADKGITGTHLNTYGTKACAQYTGQELDTSGVDPKVMRAFLASGVRTDFAGMKTLHGAGYVNGADLKAASRAMGTNDPAVLADARRFATGDQLATFRFYTRDQITSGDARAIGRLTKLGQEDYSRLFDNARAQYTLANVLVDRRKNVLDIHADIIEAGIEPEHLGRMSRAGIPVDKAAAHASDTDLWAAGAPYRAAVMTEQARLLAAREIRSTTEWAFTEATYRDGAAQ
jgi:hypothetical protein